MLSSFDIKMVTANQLGKWEEGNLINLKSDAQNMINNPYQKKWMCSCRTYFRGYFSVFSFKMETDFGRLG